MVPRQNDVAALGAEGEDHPGLEGKVEELDLWMGYGHLGQGAAREKGRGEHNGSAATALVGDTDLMRRSRSERTWGMMTSKSPGPGTRFRDTFSGNFIRAKFSTGSDKKSYMLRSWALTLTVCSPSQATWGRNTWRSELGRGVSCTMPKISP